MIGIFSVMLVFLSLSSVCLDFWFVATVRYNIALYLQGFPDGSVVKNLPAKAGDMGSIPGSRRFPGGENGNPLQYSCLENSMGRGDWWATAHRVAKSWTSLSMQAHTQL